ncbi:hypothetical protein HDV04_001706 [Boothiomyces sp. JEL0838]|nr:hypothetical protein HDV04_001706 [Boothiomyces sp. JEL0838]
MSLINETEEIVGIEEEEMIAIEEELEPCSICLSNPTKSTLIPCFHTFCFSCIKKWLINNPTCPLCKQQTELVSNNTDILEIKDLKRQPNKWGKGPMAGIALRKYIYKHKKQTIVQKKEIIVKPELKEWITRDLEAIGIHSDLLTNYIYASFIQYKNDPDIQKQLCILLQDYLTDYTELFVGELIRFSCSKLNIKTFDSYIKHE